MCGGFPNSTTRGKPAPRMTLWEAIVILWREMVSDTRPDRGGNDV
jgi:hypothetical protein